MGRLYIPTQFFDENGDPLDGGKLYTYDISATTTPKATKSDAGLTTNHANPVVMDGDGFIPEVFAATGEGYYCVVKTAAGAAVGEPFTIYALGEDTTGSLTRTFADGRWTVTSGDVDGVNSGILVEYGPPSPTNTGGYTKESGYAGTQGDKKIVDFEEVEYTGGVTYAGSTKQNVTAVSSTSIDLSTSDFFTKSISSGTTFTFDNATASKAQAFILVLTISSSASPTWPASVDWAGGVTPTLGNGKHVLGFLTTDGGTNWLGFVGGLAFA